MSKKKKTSPITIIILIILLCVLAYTGYQYLGNKDVKIPQSGNKDMSITTAIKNEGKPNIEKVEIEIKEDTPEKTDDEETKTPAEKEKEKKELEDELKKLTEEIEKETNKIENREKEINDELFPTEGKEKEYDKTKDTEIMIKKINDKELLNEYKKNKGTYKKYIIKKQINQTKSN